MVALEDVPLCPVEAVYPHPLVARAAGDESILQDRMDRRRRGCVGQCQTERLAAVWERRNERHCLARGDHEPVCLRRELHRGDRVREREARCEVSGTQIPPSVQMS